MVARGLPAPQEVPAETVAMPETMLVAKAETVSAQPAEITPIALAAETVPTLKAAENMPIATAAETRPTAEETINAAGLNMRRKREIKFRVRRGACAQGGRAGRCRKNLKNKRKLQAQRQMRMQAIWQKRRNQKKANAELEDVIDDRSETEANDDTTLIGTANGDDNAIDDISNDETDDGTDDGADDKTASSTNNETENGANDDDDMGDLTDDVTNENSPGEPLYATDGGTENETDDGAAEGTDGGNDIESDISTDPEPEDGEEDLNIL